MTFRIAAAALLAMAACGGTSSEAAAPPPGPSFDLAIAVPRTTHLVVVPGAGLRPQGRRDLASTIRACWGDGPAPWDVVRNEATCGALRLDGDRVIVPFAAPARGFELLIDRARVDVGPSRHLAPVPVSREVEASGQWLVSTTVRAGGRLYECGGFTDDDAIAGAIADVCASLRAP